ncbi:serine-type d-ala-d-ala carboxypeptidase [Leptolyngbya sp. Heron Island J]|uniref:serine hydrolase n=1 Tax=Leptolyngbya sp. Heron Island J TaxID=1385935 RepID=UPI0003B9FAD1|nr:serine hydrolase [Leptolyngbya sp. Heron Island J]ESA32201.1 serine-type d-ala-d-ala carboxypeptidase [Leptolyngbya sp. Heron Island J]
MLFIPAIPPTATPPVVVSAELLPSITAHDELLGRAVHAQQLGSRGDDYLHGGANNDRLLGKAGHDQLSGGSGNDILLGDRGNDRLFGQAGRDRIRGGLGHDRLDGGTGQDRLFGGSGRDHLIDRDGGDVLVGGTGADEFWIGNGTQGITRIRDFQIGRDRIKFTQLGITYDQLTFNRQGRHTIISHQDQPLVKLNNIRHHQLKANNFEFGDADLIPILQAALETTEAPGANMYITTGDGSVWHGAFGLANLENGTPMPADAAMDIGSITKSMVAVITLQLMQEGKLSLDDTLSQWLPNTIGKIENSETITLCQLLNHSSGIPEFLDEDFAEVILSDPHRIWQPEDFLQLAYGEPGNFPPGERHSYSNTNYTLLGLVIEAATGDTLAEQLRSRLFEPLGMNASSVVYDNDMAPNVLRGYVDIQEIDPSAESQLVPIFFHPTAQGFGEGGVISSVADLARFSGALHDGELLTPDTFNLIQQESLLIDEEDGDRYGLGLELHSTPGGPLIGHSGGFPGAGSFMYFLPEQQLTIVTIENQEETAGKPFINLFKTLLAADE